MGLSSKEVNMMKMRLKWGSVQTEKSFSTDDKNNGLLHKVYHYIRNWKYYIKQKKRKLVHMADNYWF